MLHFSVCKSHTTHGFSIRSDERLKLKTQASETAEIIGLLIAE